MRFLKVFVAFVTLAVLIVGFPSEADALVDDFEDDFWLPFTHFHLGDRAIAAYDAGVARSGTRSYHVGISGWTVRDFGSAYGYALFATAGSAITEMRLSLLYASLADSAASPWDAYAAGVSLDLLDPAYRSLGTYRYITAYRASQNAGRCGPTTADWVLGRDVPLGTWDDLGRNPSADFPAAPWRSAEFIKVSVGFLCTAGLTGASYSLYFDDFAMDTDAGDTDADSLGDLEEEMRLYAIALDEGDVPLAIPGGGSATAEINGPLLSGDPSGGLVSLDLETLAPQDLSVTLEVSNGTGSSSHLLWDPGLHARTLAILSPVHSQAVRGMVDVTGSVEADQPGALAQLFVDGHWTGTDLRSEDNTFRIAWPTDPWPEGLHRLAVKVTDGPSSSAPGPISKEVVVLVDRTPPDLLVTAPLAGATLTGLVVVATQAFDANRVAVLELWIDGVRADVREEGYTNFVYDTLDLLNGPHVFEVRARDHAGNEARRALTVYVDNQAPAPLRPCLPACNLTSGTNVGDLPPTSFTLQERTSRLASGDRLQASEALRVPWRPGVTFTSTGLSVVLDLLRDPRTPEIAGMVAPGLQPSDLSRITAWRIVVDSRGTGSPGVVRGASVLLAFRTLPGAADTDGDGVTDGAERAMGKTLPVVADLDDDGLMDGRELGTQAVFFRIDGWSGWRDLHTDPAEPDGDRDGLSDGEELLPPEGYAPSDPTVADTDGDGLPDGLERNTYASDPTLSDTDRDTLADGYEVVSHALLLSVNGTTETRPVLTSPISADSDLDGLRDAEEWNGAALTGFPTDPSDPDTDDDGLSDGDEIAGRNRRPTSPLAADTDGDGLVDGVDLSPGEFWALAWKTEYEPGLIRFTQRYHALGVHGAFAGIYTYDLADDSCAFLSDHTDEATRNSQEAPSDVTNVINTMFSEAGEDNLTATQATYMGLESTGLSEYVYGECSLLAPRQYRIQYVHDDHVFDVDFVNVLPMTIRDDADVALSHASLEIPLTPLKDQSLLLQVVVRPDADRGAGSPTDGTALPAFLYSLHTGDNFSAAPPFYRNVAVGALIEDHAYEFNLRIPREVAKEGNGVERAGQRLVTLVLTPLWLTTDGADVRKSALDPSTIRIGAAITRHQDAAELISAKLDTDITALESALPGSAEGLSTGYYTWGGFSVYVFHLGDAFDNQAPGTVDAIYLAGDTAEELAQFQEGINWVPRETWVKESRDGFGIAIGVMKILRRGISLTAQLSSGMIAPIVSMPAWTWQTMSFDRFSYVVTKMESVETSAPYYVIGEFSTVVASQRVPHPEIPSVWLTETRLVEFEARREIVDDIDDSTLLTGVKYSNLRAGLQGVAIGATLAVFGSQAVLAFRDGDAVKGTVYALAGATSVIGIVKSNIVLVDRAFQGLPTGIEIRVKLGVVAAIAVGGILSSYELYLASQTADPIKRLSHYEAGGAVMADTFIGVVPLFGAAAMLGWQLGLGITVGLQMLLGIMPNILALRIVSSPGRTAVFLFEYVFASAIPADVAEDALANLLNSLAEAARFSNSLIPPRPTVLLAP